MTDQLSDDLDTPGPPPTAAAAPGHPPRPGAVLGLVVGAIVLVTGLGVAIVTGREAAQAADDARDIRSDGVAPFDVGHGDLITALQDERNFAVTHMLGFEGALALPVSDNDDARARTDEALAELRARIDEQTAVVADAYAPASEGLAGVAGLRDRVDAVPVADRSARNTDLAQTVFEEYSTHIDALFDASSESVAAVADPFTRRGLILVDLGAEQVELTARLRRALLVASIDGGLDTPDEIAEVAANLPGLRENEAAIEAQATGDFQVHADALLASDEVRELPQIADSALATGQVHVGELLSSVSVGDPEASGYAAFRDGITDTILDGRHDLEAAATARQRRYTLIAVAAAVIAIAAFVVVVLAAGAVARSRAPRPASHLTM
jgi:Nitrate and nitrite sensing